MNKEHFTTAFVAARLAADPSDPAKALRDADDAYLETLEAIRDRTCPECMGTGITRSYSGPTRKCQQCQGSGKFVPSLVPKGPER